MRRTMGREREQEEAKEEEGKDPPLILNNLINFFLNLLFW
jgi:hypothetical protein